MALEDISNRVEEVDGVTRVYCANHEDPACGNGDDALGFAPAELVVGVGWLRVDDALACTHYCAAKVAGYDKDAALEAKSKAFYDDPITEEEVAAMSAGPGPQKLELSALAEFSYGGEE